VRAHSRIIDHSHGHSFCQRIHYQVPDTSPASANEVKTVLDVLQGNRVCAGVSLMGLQWGDGDLEKGKIRIERAIEVTKARGIRIKAPKTRHGRRVISLPPGCGRSPEGTAKSSTRTENEARWRCPCPLSAESEAPPARRTEVGSQSCFSASFDARAFFPKSGRYVGWQRNLESRSVMHVGCRRQFAAVLLNYHFTDRQAQPCSFCLRGDERIKNACQLVGINSGACVLQGNGN
jgi:hypothetical protein